MGTRETATPPCKPQVNPPPKTELGKHMAEIVKAGYASGVRRLSRDEINDELRRRRAG